MREIIFSLATGFIVGGVFRMCKLPVPAPASWAGIMGIVGLFLGYLVASKIFNR